MTYQFVFINYSIFK